MTGRCRQCADAPHPDILSGLHANYLRLTRQHLRVPPLVEAGQRTWLHVHYAHQRPDAESPHVLAGGRWVPRGGIVVWQQAS